jgi:indolepyruvate ferredoxin oxidoreductase beta subunit
MTATRPFTLLIAALGGEGGGVLTDWIVSAAEHSGLPVQSTSIPGVAQRTARPPYYVEIFPTPLSELGGKRPVLALAPGVGDVDLWWRANCSKPGRAIANGFVTADRTLLIASVSRVYLTSRRCRWATGATNRAPAQGRRSRMRSASLFDMETAAKQAGAIVNAVMLGAIAGSGRCRFRPRRSRRRSTATARRSSEPARFPRRAGRPRASSCPPRCLARQARRESRRSPRSKPSRRAAATGARDRHEGVRRLVAYQDALTPPALSRRPQPFTDAKVLAETARHLAVRMSFEDVIRVAEAKIAPERFRRIEGEIGAKDQPYVITEFSEARHRGIVPGAPPRLARAIVAYSKARLARQGLFRHGAEDHDRCGAICGSGRSPSCIAGARRAGATPRSRWRSKPGSRASPRPRGCRRSWRWKSPNARG